MERGLIQIIDIIFYIWYLMLIARILLGWIQVDMDNPTLQTATQILYAATEPVLRPIREFLPQTGMFDFSPIIAIILVQLVQLLLEQLIRSIF